MKKIDFNSNGLKLVGNLYYPASFQKGKQYPAIVVSGSWTTVKEQMAGLYAEKLANEGFITLAKAKANLAFSKVRNSRRKI